MATNKSYTVKRLINFIKVDSRLVGKEPNADVIKEIVYQEMIAILMTIMSEKEIRDYVRHKDICAPSNAGITECAGVAGSSDVMKILRIRAEAPPQGGGEPVEFLFIPVDDYAELHHSANNVFRENDIYYTSEGESVFYYISDRLFNQYDFGKNPVMYYVSYPTHPKEQDDADLIDFPERFMPELINRVIQRLVNNYRRPEEYKGQATEVAQMRASQTPQTNQNK